MLIRRHFAVAIAFALINIASLPDAARANESGFPPWPTPPNVPSWCRYERQCGRHGCASRWICPPQTFVSAYLWQVQDHTPPEALARYDDAWCRVYGPAGSPVYCSVEKTITTLACRFPFARPNSAWLRGGRSLLAHHFNRSRTERL
jgi:hypothetical protein